VALVLLILTLPLTLIGVLLIRILSGRTPPIAQRYWMTCAACCPTPTSSRFSDFAQRSLLPLMPMALESFDLRGYDLV
jgi:hypothetical protein